MKLLMFLPDGWPTFRPDVEVLFGKYLPRKGVTTDIVTHATGEAPARDWQGGEQVLSDRSANKIGKFLHALKRLFGPVAGYDIVQVRDMPLFAVLAVLRARLARKPFIYWMSFPLAEMDLRLSRRTDISAIRRAYLFTKGVLGRLALYRIVLPSADLVVAQSPRMVADIRAEGVKPRRIIAVPMCVDDDAIADAPAVRPERAGPAVVGYLGTCDRARHPELMFQCVKVLVDRGLDVNLLIVGDAAEPADREWFAQLATEHGLEGRVEITGWVTRDVAKARIGTVDVALSIFPPDPLLDSASPTKLIEYLAMGLPVVCNDHPDQADVMRSCDAGLCVPYGVEDIANGIERVIRSEDCSVRARQSGPAFVRRERSYSRAAETVVEQYAEILNRD